MFLVNSRLGRFTAAPFLEHPFSLGYGVILQSSLAIVLSLTSGFSPCPCVSIFGTGRCVLVLEAFPGSLLSAIPYLPKLSVCIAPSPCAHRISLVRRYLACPSYSSSWLPEPSPSLHRHTSGTGISTRRPSATPFGLALGPDYPREDEPSSGDLGPSVRGILTHVPLLTPAFSLPCAPHALPVMLLRCMQCSPTTFLSIASVSCLAPVNYRRRVIRLVSCYALFEGWLLLSQPPSCLHVSTSFST